MLTFFIFAFWPLSLMLANSKVDLPLYIAPSLLIAATYFLYKKGSVFWLLPIYTIPLISPKLALLPLFFSTVFFLFEKQKRNLRPVILSVVLLAITWPGYKGQSIFTKNHDMEQEIIRNGNLYPSVFLARLFHNKGRIYLDKFNDNLLALTDPGNYFFTFHPREIVGNQDLQKFPSLTILFLIFGLFNLKKLPNKNFTLSLLFGTVLALSTLSLFDRNDFVLWFPISLLIIHGLTIYRNNYQKKFKIISPIILIFTIAEFIYIFTRYL